ncbi:hypothetical protein M9458_055369, partial [Cirrhinus mrigala]
TTFTEHTTPIALPATTTNNDPPPPETQTLTQELEGASVIIKKQCPKCHTTQTDFNIKQTYHRCNSCKILRRNASYTTKCNSSLIFKVHDNEASLTITNSLLTQFIRHEQDITDMDSQDIEEYLIQSGPLTVEYTIANQIIRIHKAPSTAEQIAPRETDGNGHEIHDTDLPSHSPTTVRAALQTSALTQCSKRHGLNI